MKAKKVYEIQNFKRGEDPYDKLNISQNRPFKENDKIQLLRPVYWNGALAGYGDRQHHLKLSGPLLLVNQILQFDEITGFFGEQDGDGTFQAGVWDLNDYLMANPHNYIRL